MSATMQNLGKALQSTMASTTLEHDKKVCCLGLTSLLALPSDQIGGEAPGRVFRAALDLLVAYKDQVAEAAKEEEAEDDDDMDGFQLMMTRIMVLTRKWESMRRMKMKLIA
ncbi:hypothetical protein ES288_D02G014300v1 [Gossypium darwinii]|uniref:Uncharacterized protein n=1 Tax=Gossypium darwinii TaxID=34276 RepID=A0A5D2DA25_GOSDA|nr:hypothetical protein ES288_D02G014300v1 [Gossypium darwinii]